MMERFFGVWVLDPDASSYGDGSVPQSAVYSILPAGDELWFHVDWRDADGRRHESRFHGTLRQATPGADQKMQLSTSFDGEVLRSEMVHNARAVHCVERRVVDVGETERLAVTERWHDGVQVLETRASYRRAAVKQVLVYRRDLAMRKGKIAAQCAHASMAVFFKLDEGPSDRLSIPLDGPMAAWAKGRSAKVVLSVEGEAELLAIHGEAQARGIPTAMITDSGKTEFHGQPTRTAVAVGPAVDVEVDAITGPDGVVPTKLA